MAAALELAVAERVVSVVMVAAAVAAAVVAAAAAAAVVVVVVAAAAVVVVAEVNLLIADCDRARTRCRDGVDRDHVRDGPVPLSASLAGDRHPIRPRRHRPGAVPGGRDRDRAGSARRAERTWRVCGRRLALFGSWGDKRGGRRRASRGAGRPQRRQTSSERSDAHTHQGHRFHLMHAARQGGYNSCFSCGISHHAVRPRAGRS